MTLTFGQALAMKRLATRQGDAAPDPDAFRMTVRTTGAVETFTIPCQNLGTFNATVGWGDGSTSTITAYNDADLAHEYATAGDYQISITGTFPHIYFFNTGTSKGKVISVDNLGAVGWITFDSAFWGCSNMTSFTAGTCDTSSVTELRNMLRACSSLAVADVQTMDTSSVTSVSRALLGLGSLTSCTISGWNVEAVNTWNFFAQSTTIPTADYDATLIAWAAQDVVDSQSVDFGSSTYTSGGAAETARTSLINDDLWTITDGGAA
jgi:hypothetical protein